MKKVLIAIDYNTSAEQVSEAGYQLAASLKARVALVHVIADPSIYTVNNYSPIMGFEGFDTTQSWQLTANLEKEANRFLQYMADKLDENTGTTIETFVKGGEFAQSVLDTAKEWNADIIVMGSHSHSGLERLFLGSVVENVLLHTTVPMFIIPTKEGKNN